MNKHLAQLFFFLLIAGGLSQFNNLSAAPLVNDDNAQISIAVLTPDALAGNYEIAIWNTAETHQNWSQSNPATVIQMATLTAGGSPFDEIAVAINLNYFGLYQIHTAGYSPFLQNTYKYQVQRGGLDGYEYTVVNSLFFEGAGNC